MAPISSAICNGRAAFGSALVAILIFGLYGCGGGDNSSGNGVVKDSAENDLPVRCLNEPEPGPCNKRITRYFYDYPSDKCRAFQYGGCQGRVLFETLEACRETCEGSRR